MLLARRLHSGFRQIKKKNFFPPALACFARTFERCCSADTRVHHASLELVFTAEMKTTVN